MYIRHVVLFFIIFSSACKSDVIPCPEVRAQKLRHAHYRHVREKDQAAESINASKKVNRYRDPYLFTKAETLDSKMDVEDWDCPKPGTRKKIIKENKKRMEKKIQLMAKKKSGNPSSDYISITNSGN